MGQKETTQHPERREALGEEKEAFTKEGSGSLPYLSGLKEYKPKVQSSAQQEP